MDDNREYPFIQFCQKLLNDSQVAEPLFQLQHQGGFNINIVLYLLWLAKERYGRLTKRNIKLLLSQILLWHQRVITELKFTHALVANQNTEVAQHIKQALEEHILKAYVIEQRMLYESRMKTAPMKRSSIQELQDACASMMNYCEIKNDLLLDEDYLAFVKLCQVVFNQIKPDDIEKQLSSVFSRLKKSDGPTQMMWSEL